MRRNAATAAGSGDNGSFPVIPTEAEPLNFARGRLSEAKRRDPIMSLTKRRSLHSASLKRGYDPRESG
jgi:hypothetical protein